MPSRAEIALHWDIAGEPAAALEPSIRAGLDAAHVYALAEARQHFERAAAPVGSLRPGPGRRCRSIVSSFSATARRSRG